jgi:hypothetical protein
VKRSSARRTWSFRATVDPALCHESFASSTRTHEKDMSRLIMAPHVEALANKYRFGAILVQCSVEIGRRRTPVELHARLCYHPLTWSLRVLPLWRIALAGEGPAYSGDFVGDCPCNNSRSNTSFTFEKRQNLRRIPKGRCIAPLRIYYLS